MLGAHLLDEINARHGTDFRLDGRYEGGETGALRVVAPDGRRFALKERGDGDPAGAARTTSLLRRLGYPAPEYVVVGGEYSVQEELPGRPLRPWRPLDASVVTRLLELNELQEGRALLEPRDWPASLVRTVLEGGEGYMLLDTLRRHSRDARLLLERCQAAVLAYAGEARTQGDVVHFDFTPANVLADGTRVTGVIDWDGTHSGDRLFDLATLLYYVPEAARVRAYTYIVERAGEGVLAAYLAHVAVRQTEWSLRLHSRETGAFVLRYSLEVTAGFPR